MRTFPHKGLTSIRQSTFERESKGGQEMQGTAKVDRVVRGALATELPVTPERSRLMAGIRAKDTKPERVVRGLAHSLGYRFRLHRRDLPGCPDVVFPARGKVIFIHGCFWHQHPGCRKATLPKTRSEFWKTKLLQNRARDNREIERLETMGWSVLVIWECELKDTELLARRLRSYLGRRARRARRAGRGSVARIEVRKK
jgi:DNA mismatch endonuclease Vsr